MTDVTTNHSDLETYARNAKHGLSMMDAGREQWRLGVIELGLNLFKAREKHKNDATFGDWCNANDLGLDVISKDHRAALIQIGRHLTHYDPVLRVTDSTSVRLIVQQNPPPGIATAAIPPRHTTKPGPKPSKAKPAIDLRVVTKALAPLFKELKGGRLGRPSQPEMAKTVDDIRALLSGWKDPVLTETLGPLFERAKAETAKPIALFAFIAVLDQVHFAQQHLDGWASNPGAQIPTPTAPKVTVTQPVRSAPVRTPQVDEEEDVKPMTLIEASRVALDNYDTLAVAYDAVVEIANEELAVLRAAGIAPLTSEDGHAKFAISDRAKAVAWFDEMPAEHDEAHPDTPQPERFLPGAAESLAADLDKLKEEHRALKAKWETPSPGSVDIRLLVEQLQPLFAEVKEQSTRHVGLLDKASLRIVAGQGQKLLDQWANGVDTVRRERGHVRPDKLNTVAEALNAVVRDELRAALIEISELRAKDKFKADRGGSSFGSMSDLLNALRPERQQEIAEINAMAREAAEREEEERALDSEVWSMVQDAASPDFYSDITTAHIVDYVLGNLKTTKDAVEESLRRLEHSKAIHKTSGGLWKPGEG
jgi:hypothetical protein